MDDLLKALMDGACKRGNRYVKGETALRELPEKMAELGVLFLEKAKKIPDLQGEKLREELVEIQNKVDDMRKSLFSSKFNLR